MSGLDKRKIKKELDKRNLSFSFYKRVESTFNAYKECCPDITLAKMQTGGRGRLDREFFSPRGGIYLCIKTEKAPLITVNTAVGALKALKRVGIEAKVKWINDIFIDNKKVCGILVREINGNAIIGIGLNYFIKKFPPYLKNAKSVFSSIKGINEFTLILIDEILNAVKNPDLEYYKKHLLAIGEKIKINEKEVLFLDIDQNANLIYKDEEQIKTLNYGDICL